MFYRDAIASLPSTLVFNVIDGNGDDHLKNVGVMMTRDRQWVLGPAYDRTYSQGSGGAHSTTVTGKADPIPRTDLLELAKQAGAAPKAATA